MLNILTLKFYANFTPVIFTMSNLVHIYFNYEHIFIIHVYFTVFLKLLET